MSRSRSKLIRQSSGKFFIIFNFHSVRCTTYCYLKCFQDDPEYGVVAALSDNPGTVIHQNRETPIRLPDQDFTAFFTEEGSYISQASKGVTQNMLQDSRIYGKCNINQMYNHKCSILLF